MQNRHATLLIVLNTQNADRRQSESSAYSSGGRISGGGRIAAALHTATSRSQSRSTMKFVSILSVLAVLFFALAIAGEPCSCSAPGLCVPMPNEITWPASFVTPSGVCSFALLAQRILLDEGHCCCVVPPVQTFR